MANQIITRIQVEGNDVVSFLNGTTAPYTYVRSMSQILPQNPTYISYRYDSITISQVAGEAFSFTVYTVNQVGGNTFLPLTFQDPADVVQARTIEIYRLLVTSIFKGCCECGNTEPECSIQYTAGTDSSILGTLRISGASIGINYFTANNQDFTGFWPIVQDGSWIFVFSKTDPTVYGVYQLSNYTDGGDYAQFDYTLLAGPSDFPDGTSLCVDVTSVGGSLVQGWQDTLNISSLLTQDNLVDGGGFNFEWENVNRYILNSTGYQSYISSDGSSTGQVYIQPGAVTITGTNYIDVITPGYATATPGMVLALDASGHVEYTTAGTGTISSIGLNMPPAFTVSTPNPLTSNGSFTVDGAGTALQYINGLGELATVPVYTVANGLHTQETPANPNVFHLGGTLIEDTVITTTDGATQYVLGISGTVNQNSRRPLSVSNLGLGGAAVFSDFSSGFRPNPTVQMITDNDLFKPILELTMQGDLPNSSPVLQNRISLLRLTYDGAPANARTAMDFTFKNNDVSPNPTLFPAVQLTAEVTNFTANAETANLELMMFQGGSQQVKLIMEGKGQLTLNEYGPTGFSDATTNINNALTYVLGVDNTGKVWKKLATGGGTVQQVNTAGLISGGPITNTGTITTNMATNRLVGRYSPSAGIMQEITIGAGLSLSAGGELTADGSVPVYTVNNGLSPDPLDANNFQLGGPLVQDTTITGGTVPFTNYLHVDNLSGFSLDVNGKGYLISENGDDKSQFIFTKVYALSRYENNLTGELAEISVGGDSGISDVQASLRAATVFGETGIYAGVVPGILPYTANMLGVKTPKVANGSALVGQVLTLKSMTGSEAGRVEFEDAAAPGATYTVNNGLTENPANNFQLGGELVVAGETLIGTSSTTSANKSNSLAIASSANISTLGVINNNDSSGYALSATNFGTSGGTSAAKFVSKNNASPGSGTIQIERSVTNNQTVYNALNMLRSGNTTNAVDGYGMQIRQQLGTTAGTTQNAAWFNTTWSTAADASRTGQYQILLTNNAVDPVAKLTLNGSGLLTLNEYTTSTSFAAGLTSVGVLNVDNTGKVFVGAGGGGGGVPTSRLVSTTAPLSGGGALSADLTLSIPVATNSVDGYLSATDRTAFNAKQDALSGTGLVKSTSGTITYITDNSTNWDTAYTNRITSLTTTGSSGAASLSSNTLNIPEYTLAGLGGVPTSRQLTINGTTYDLSADRSWTITSSSPLTTKGDIYTFSTANARLPVGLDTQVLIADSSTTTGLKWGSNTAPTPLGYYAQYQDNITQTLAAINTGYPIKFRTMDLSNGVTVVSDSRITIANTGVYNLQFSVQLENSDTQEHDVTIWLRKNGVDLPGSSGFIAVVAKHGGINGHIIASWNYLLDVVGGDYYELVWSGTSTQVTMPFIAAGSPPPSTASAIFTVTQQAGILAGTGITAINSLTGAVQTMAVGTTGTDFAINSAGTSHTFNLPTASAANRGALSSTDWSTFNGKQNSIGLTTVGNNLATLTDPNAITFLRVNADNTVTARTPAQVLTDLGIAGVIVLGKDMAGASAVNTTTNTVLFSVAIPANTLQANDFIELFTQIATTVTNTNTLNVRVYLNSANNLTGATQLAIFTNVVGTGSAGFMRNFFVTAVGASGNIRGFGSAVNVTNQYALSGAVMTNTAVNTTVTQYILIAVQMSAATFTTSLQGSIIKITR